jgi:hypothetical protein
MLQRESDRALQSVCRPFDCSHLSALPSPSRTSADFGKMDRAEVAQNYSRPGGGVKVNDDSVSPGRSTGSRGWLEETGGQRLQNEERKKQRGPEVNPGPRFFDPSKVFSQPPTSDL